MKHLLTLIVASVLLIGAASVYAADTSVMPGCKMATTQKNPKQCAKHGHHGNKKAKDVKPGMTTPVTK